MASNSFTELVAQAIFDKRKRVEPKKRMVGGRYGYAFHRFPIKGGISPQDVMLENIKANNPLLDRLKKRQVQNG